MKTAVAELNRLDGRTLAIRFRENVGVEANHASEIVDAGRSLFGSEIHGNLVDARNLLYVSQEARETFARQERANVSAIAVLVSSALQKTMANLYLAVSRPRIPTRLFDRESDAVAWLRARTDEVLSKD